MVLVSHSQKFHHNFSKFISFHFFSSLSNPFSILIPQHKNTQLFYQWPYVRFMLLFFNKHGINFQRKPISHTGQFRREENIFAFLFHPSLKQVILFARFASFAVRSIRKSVSMASDICVCTETVLCGMCVRVFYPVRWDTDRWLSAYSHRKSRPITINISQCIRRV